MTNNLELFKNHLYKLIKEELEGGEEEKQAGLEKALYDLVLEPADLESALTALSDIKNYGIYANNLRDPKIITKIFGPSVPATKGRVAKETWDQSSENEKLSKVIDIKSRAPQEWAKVEQQLQSKFDEWSVENDNDSFNEFILTLDAKDLPMDFFGKYASTFYPMKTPDNLKKYSGVMAKDKDFVVDGDKIVFPQKKNPFETKDYLTKVLKTIMGNAKLQYSISQKESDDQPATTSNTQGKVEKINFVKTFDTPELAAKFKKLIPKDFAEKTTVDGSKITVADITDSQKKNLITSALQFIASQPKKPIKEGDIEPLPHEKLHGYTSETTPEGEHEVWAVYFDPKTDTYNKRHRVPASTVFGKNANIRTPMKESVKDYFKDPINAADARGWMKNPKLSDTEKKDKIKSVMKDPSKFNDLMDEFTKELKPLQKPMKESIKDQIKQAVMEVLQEKKLSKAEKNKKEDIVKAMAKQGAPKDSKTYAIATAKAKKLAEGEGDTSMDDILLAFQGALDIQDDEEQDKALKVVYNALKDKVKGKLGQAADYAKDKLTKYADNLEEAVDEPISLPTAIQTKANSKVVDAKSLAKILKDIYTQIQSKESIDFSKNQNIKYVIQYLDKAINEKPAAKA
jgi:hypothetical protein